jgi:hypothetical protein
MAETIAAYEAMKNLGVAKDEANKLLSGLSGEGLRTANALASTKDAEGNLNMADFFAGFTKSEVEAFKTDLEDGEFSQESLNKLGLTAD